MTSATAPAQSTSPSWRQTQAKLANAQRNSRPATEIARLRTQFKFEKLADHVREVAPCLETSQRSELEELLKAGEARA